MLRKLFAMLVKRTDWHCKAFDEFAILELRLRVVILGHCHVHREMDHFHGRATHARIFGLRSSMISFSRH